MTMQRSDTISEIAKALSKTQGQMRAASKDSINPHFKNRYADLASVWDACREPLAANGLALVQLPVEGTPGHCTLETMLMHTSGEYISSTASVKLQQDTAQGYGSALTYLRRYSLAAMLGVVADDDDDGNGAQLQQRQQQKPAASKPVPQPTNNEHQRLMGGLKRQRDSLKKKGGTPRELTAAQVAAMSIDELKAEIEATKQQITELVARQAEADEPETVEA